MCAYQEVRNVSFSENFAYVLNGWPLCEFAALFFLTLFIFELYVNDFETTCIFNV